MAEMRIFLSHSSADKTFADALVAALRGAGADVWYDEHNLGTGHLRRTIMQELARRPVFIVLLSKAAFASEWVQDECEWAYNLLKREPNRLYLPVIARTYDASDFNALLYIEAMKRIEAPGRQPFALDEAIARTLRELALTPRGATPAPAAPRPAESADDLIARGKALSAQKRYADAIPLFERATQLAPDNFDAWFNLGLARNEAHQYGKDIEAYDRALALKPNDAAIWYNKGIALYDLKRLDEALAVYERALALDPNYALAWDGKGTVLYELKRLDESLAAYECALARDPNFAFALHNKGFILSELKRHDEALAAYDRALALGLGQYESFAWENKATALRALGREAEAQEAEWRAKELGG